MRYISHTPAQVQAMLETVGKTNLDSLFDSIPDEAKLSSKLNIPSPTSELLLKDELTKLSSRKDESCFLGAGASRHFVPELVSQLLLRGEWLTAYTPYQPEVSQGTLQAIFEFQTMVSSLLGTDAANASMYDGATALAESLLMAKRLQPNKTIAVLSKAVHPEYRQVCRTFLTNAKIQLLEIDFDSSGTTSLGALEQCLQSNHSDIFAVGYQTPNFFGRLEKQRSIIDLTHKNNILAIACNTEPLAFGQIDSPGNLGADIVTSEGLGFCGHLSLGAPGVGLFGASSQYLRQMPGRLCGATIDKEGKTGFTLTLASREQHIRREKATSNICTNHGLMALAFTITLSLYGKTGFTNLSKSNLKKTIHFRNKIKEAGLKILFEGPFFNETVVAFESKNELKDKTAGLEEKNIYAGLDLTQFYPELPPSLLVNTTELHSDKQIETLAMALGKGV